MSDNRAVPTVQLENDHLRVTEWRFAPGAATGWHRHGYDYVVVPVVDGELELVGPDGGRSRAQLHKGQSYLRKAGLEHDVIKLAINCDMGESFGLYKIGDDEGMMPHITIANVACGFHASDPTVMARTVRLAKQHKVRVGAHPSLPDLQGFGRREMKMGADELTNCI